MNPQLYGATMYAEAWDAHGEWHLYSAAHPVRHGMPVPNMRGMMGYTIERMIVERRYPMAFTMRIYWGMHEHAAVAT